MNGLQCACPRTDCGWSRYDNNSSSDSRFPSHKMHESRDAALKIKQYSSSSTTHWNITGLSILGGVLFRALAIFNAFGAVAASNKNHQPSSAMASAIAPIKGNVRSVRIKI